MSPAILLDGVTVTVFSAAGVGEAVVSVLVMIDPLALVFLILLLLMLPPEEVSSVLLAMG